jgi:non-ribosomal peptide synthetase component F
MLSKEEEEKILYKFNETKKDYPNKTFSTLFEEQVEKTPNELALVFENKKLTYKELNEKANSLAYYLRNEKKIKKEDLVGIMINRSLEMIIAMLAVMKAGGAYIPIDPSFPNDRIDYMLSSSSASVLLTSKKLENKINFENKTIIDLENNDIYSLPNNNLENINTLDDILYIIFTSGSTGRPKGVIQTRKNIS